MLHHLSWQQETSLVNPTDNPIRAFAIHRLDPAGCHPCSGRADAADRLLSVTAGADGHACADRHAHGHADAFADANRYRHCDSYANYNAQSNCDGYASAHGHADRYPDCDDHRYSHIHPIQPGRQRPGDVDAHRAGWPVADS